jgi:aldose sugar dehydrogenase
VSGLIRDLEFYQHGIYNDNSTSRQLQPCLVVLSSVTIVIFVTLTFQSEVMMISQKLFPVPVPVPVPVIVFAQYQKDIKSINQHSAPLVRDKSLDVEMVATGIDFPASMSFVDFDDILVTEKNTGMVKRILKGTMLEKPVLNVDVRNYWEDGLLGIAVDKHPSHNHPVYAYLYYSKAVIDGKDDYKINRTEVVLSRYEYSDGKLINPKILLNIPYPQNFTFIHNGGVVLIGPDNNIYLVVGDLGYPVTKAQNVNSKSSTNGNGTSAIYRLTKEGSAAKGNPIGGDMAKYYAYGIRNSFGMDFDPVTGKLWDTENGPWYADEVNLVEPGFNSGWKTVQGLSNLYHLYSKKQFQPDKLVDFDGKGKYSEPEFVWNETFGVTAIKFLDSDKLGKNYEDDVFIGDYDNGNIYHFNLNSNRTALSLDSKLADKIANNRDELQDVIFAQGFGPIVDIEVGPDGYLYVLSLYEAIDNCNPNTPYSDCFLFDAKGIDGSIFRIVPKNK